MLMLIPHYISFQYKCALVFDAVYLFAKAMKELDRSVMLLTPNTTCDDIIPWSGGKSLYDFINTVSKKK